MSSRLSRNNKKVLYCTVRTKYTVVQYSTVKLLIHNPFTSTVHNKIDDSIMLRHTFDVGHKYFHGRTINEIK